MQTPSQLLTQEVSMVRCPLMREADSYLIFVFSLDVALLTPCGANQRSVVHLCPHGRHRVSFKFSFTILFAKLVPQMSPFLQIHTLVLLLWKINI